jgi:hypothetical protein
MNWQILSRAPYILFLLFIICGVLLASMVLLIPASRLTEPAVKLMTGLVWPYIFLSTIVLFRPQVKAFISEIIVRIQSGAGFKFASFEITAVTQRIPEPGVANPVTLENIALLHTSFFSPEGTRRFNDGQSYYQIEVIVVAPESVMARIESVIYCLEDSWPEKLRRPKGNPASRFKMKELANGTSIVRAEIRFHGQDAPLLLNRFIDLRPDGPRL